MARRRKKEGEANMDSLLDALTNVVGILLLVLIISALGISQVVQKIQENLPEVTKEDLEELKINFDKTRQNLAVMQQTFAEMEKRKEPEEKELDQIALQLEELEKNNTDLTEKVSDLDELKRKIEEQEAQKKVNEDEVQVASTEIADLRAILDQMNPRETLPPTVVKLPNPRPAPEDSGVRYIVCKYGKLYFVGDPYEHAFKIGEVIDQNKEKLIYEGPATGSYVFPLETTRKNDAGSGFLPVTEAVRMKDRNVEALGLANLKITELSTTGEVQPEKDVLSRLFGADDRKDFPLYKIRLDPKKVKDFFGDGKLGPPGLRYFITENSDKLRLGIGFKEEEGLSRQQFEDPNSPFQLACKQASVNRNTVFYFHVAPDSFDTYLAARAIVENYRVPAGWTTFLGDVLTPAATVLRDSTTVSLGQQVVPAAAQQLASTAGVKMLASLKELSETYDDNLEQFVPKEMTDPAEKTKFLADLKAERLKILTTRLQPYTRQIFEAAVSSTQAHGDKQVRIDVQPPDIPHQRFFTATSLPTKPPEPPKPDAPRRPPPSSPAGKTLILD